MAWAIKNSQRCFRVMARPSLPLHADGLGRQKFPTLLQGDGPAITPALYFNCFVLIAQLFQKVPALIFAAKCATFAYREGPKCHTSHHTSAMPRPCRSWAPGWLGGRLVPPSADSSARRFTRMSGGAKRDRAGRNKFQVLDDWILGRRPGRGAAEVENP